MMRISEIFTRHPATVGETYGQHFRAALGFAARMLIGGLACLVHAVLPFLFVRTGSGIIDELHDRMVVNRYAASHVESLPIRSAADAKGIVGSPSA